ncbi:short-chain dehydrogenase [Variovorax sp. J31P179]|uniref:short-chain dehydrogenase n=1 Tax=Variovorax sp. J31P179 TaxID=3053508 RepID=UPI0025772256|nr:short-chain dehydrogenase [Variovorax sp. J31P179]MDM0081642.1 short-chain dehydrogenase [Variovorax sp. J31P179]
MRTCNTPIRTIVVRPAKPRDPLALAVARRLGALIFRRQAPDRLGRMDLDQRVRELGEW